MKILIIEDDAEYAYLLKRMLSMESEERVEIKNAHRMDEAQSLLASINFDAILLDLALPDCQGFDTFLHVNDAAPETPIVVLTAFESESLAVQAVKEGAQDYLAKIQVNNRILMRSLRFAVERQQSRKSLQRLTMINELTGLYNRRGFNALGEKYLQLAQRNTSSLLLLFADLDGLKRINDRFGHPEGDHALAEVASLLQKTCREADVVAHLSGDEFAVLAMDVSPKTGEILANRLIENLSLLNSSHHRPYLLDLSFGMAYFDPFNPITLEELVAKADAAMYEHKRKKKRLPLSSDDPIFASPQ